MQRIITGLAAIALGFSVVASTAHAQFHAPFKGKQVKGNLMSAFEPCTVPDTTTGDGHQACTAMVRSDPSCGFGGGQGKIQLKMQTIGNADARIKLQNLDSGCEGETLGFVANVRRTGQFCGNAKCTIVDTVFTFGNCVVPRNACTFSAQFTWPGGTTDGETEILDMYVLHGADRVFDVGLVQNNP